MQQQFEVQIPFQGFYHSMHDAVLDCELEQIEDSGQSLYDLFCDAADYQNTRFEYAKAYAIAFGDEYLPKPCALSNLDSPREYNFETDRIFVKIDRSTLDMIYRLTAKDRLIQKAKENHTSYDGFMSFYSPDISSWGHYTTWDHNQLHTLLQAFLPQDWEETVVENFEASNWMWADAKADRPWKIFNYLEKRAS